MNNLNNNTTIAKNEYAIVIKNLTKEYRLYRNEKHRMLGLFLKKSKLVKFQRKLANSNISFKVRRGDSVALFGENGAGKSTLLKIITEVVYPTSGSIEINGRVSAMLELTAGFDNEFTGRENIHLKATLLGINREKILKIENDIIEFSNLHEYIDQPVRTYSSGMKARLGFSVVAFTEPDILVIDEALSVGDKKFQEKCRQKINEIRQKDNVTLLFVTHSQEAAKKFCNRGVVLKDGRAVYDGPIKYASQYYDGILAGVY